MSSSLNDDDLANLPAARGIYQITNGRISYVGLSDNIRRRMRQHLESSSGRSRIVLDAGRARCIVLEVLPQASDRELAEREWYWFDRLQRQNHILVNDPSSLGRTPSGRYGPPAELLAARTTPSSISRSSPPGDRSEPTKAPARERATIPLWWAIVAGVALLSFGSGYFAVKYLEQRLPWGESGQLETDESFEAPFLSNCQASLQRGDRGEAVRQLQEQLQQLGFYDSTVDGRFGAGTEAAVAAFQRQQGLTADAIAGCKTQRAIQAAIAADRPLR